MASQKHTNSNNIQTKQDYYEIGSTHQHFGQEWYPESGAPHIFEDRIIASKGHARKLTEDTIEKSLMLEKIRGLQSKQNHASNRDVNKTKAQNINMKINPIQDNENVSGANNLCPENVNRRIPPQPFWSNLNFNCSPNKMAIKSSEKRDQRFLSQRKINNPQIPNQNYNFNLEAPINTCESKLTFPQEIDNESKYSREFYHPGILEDSIRRNFDYNQAALLENTLFSPTNKQENKIQVSPTLISKFNNSIAKIIDKRKLENELLISPIHYNKLQPNQISERKHENFILDGAIRLSATPVDLEFSPNNNKPKSSFEIAVNCFVRAQEMNDYCKKVRAAEEASWQVQPEMIEQAARAAVRNVQNSDPNSNSNDLTQNCVSKSHNMYKPIEIISYIGITK